MSYPDDSIHLTIGYLMDTTTDYHRPQYHYLPAKNWMNDPNGVIHWRGHYHLFYQYNPHGANHANMHWGHAVSDDMIHWEELPIAIAPTPNSPDQGGIFSGCIVDDNGTPKAFYTGVNDDYSVQAQCMAIGNDDLTQWQKYEGNPLIPAPPLELGQTGDFRDPYVWRSDDGWYMVVGSRIEGVGGAILLYHSEDLTNWTYLNPLFIGESSRNGVMFECPNFFPLDDKWVLIISSHTGTETGTVLYWVGDFVDHQFIPEHEGVLDSGYHYASLTHEDAQGRRILYGWLREGRSVEQDLVAGWSGVQAIPRVLSLDGNNRLLMSPVPELEQARRSHHVPDLSDNGMVSVSGLQLDIALTMTIGEADIYGLEVMRSDDGNENVRIYYDRRTETIRIERTYADNPHNHDTYTQGLPHPLDDGETLDLRIMLDGSVIEVIANQRTSITSRFYASSDDSQHIRIITPSAVESIEVWEMPTV